MDEIYSDRIVIKDPIHEIQGIENHKEYFNKLNDNLTEGSFQHHFNKFEFLEV